MLNADVELPQQPKDAFDALQQKPNVFHDSVTSGDELGC
jgi:hypothetical protein